MAACDGDGAVSGSEAGRIAALDTRASKDTIEDRETLGKLWSETAKSIGLDLAPLVERARTALTRAADAALSSAPEELVLADLHEACGAFEEVTGKRTADDVLHRIFTQFCIGK